MITSLPNLGIDNDVIMRTFYISLYQVFAKHQDASSSGSFMKLSAKGAKEMIIAIISAQVRWIYIQPLEYEEEKRASKTVKPIATKEIYNEDSSEKQRGSFIPQGEAPQQVLPMEAT